MRLRAVNWTLMEVLSEMPMNVNSFLITSGPWTVLLCKRLCSETGPWGGPAVIRATWLIPFRVQRSPQMIGVCFLGTHGVRREQS